VDCIFPLEGSLQSRAAAVIGGQTEEGASGSALYRAAALFNHDCAPNVGVGFPNNDGKTSTVSNNRYGRNEPGRLYILLTSFTIPPPAQMTAMAATNLGDSTFPSYQLRNSSTGSDDRLLWPTWAAVAGGVNDQLHCHHPARNL